MLGRKQSVRNNEDWKNALDHIEETVSKKELDSLVKKTVKDIKEKCKGKKAAYAWSAGKDSLVLGEICEKAGIDQSVLVRCNLEYPAFIAWIEQNKPSGLEVINTGQDMEWLKKHPDMLFPDKSNKAAQWFHIVQHRGQARYYKEHQLEILLLGRRKADGRTIPQFLYGGISNSYIGRLQAHIRRTDIRRSQNEGIPGTVPESIWTLYQRCEERRTPWTISCQHHLGPCIG